MFNISFLYCWYMLSTHLQTSSSETFKSKSLCVYIALKRFLKFSCTVLSSKCLFFVTAISVSKRHKDYLQQLSRKTGTIAEMQLKFNQYFKKVSTHCNFQKHLQNSLKKKKFIYKKLNQIYLRKTDTQYFKAISGKLSAVLRN